jgi:hypothetical protein
VPRPKRNKETEGIRRMIHQHLQRRALIAPPVTTDVHLDEDALSAFTEGRLSERESVPVISHLVNCGFCRRITAQLVRLEFEIGPGEASSAEGQQEPGRIRRLLEDLASRVLPQSGDEAVYAYHAPAEDFRKKAEADADKKANAEEQADSAEQTDRKPEDSTE